MSSLIALPSPSSISAASSGLAALRRAAADASPVEAVRATSPARRQSPERIDDTDTRSSTSVGATGERGLAAGTAVAASGAETASGTTTVALGTDTPSSSAFITQSLSQEVVGRGLHIEPWRAAVGAYARAEDAASQTGTRRNSITV